MFSFSIRDPSRSSKPLIIYSSKSAPQDTSPGVPRKMNDFECVVPILNVKNFAASMDYYVTKLGFTKKWDWGDPPGFGCVARGKVEIFLSEGSQGQPGV